MDCFHGNLVPGGFEVALTVLGTVVSRQGNTVVLDCRTEGGRIDFVMPPMVAYPEGQIRYYAEEHALFDFPGPPPLDLGDGPRSWPATGRRRSTCTTCSTWSRTES